MRYPTIRNSWEANNKLSQSENFAKTLINSLKDTKQKFVRIYASGEFQTAKEIQAWIETAKALPEKKFFGYSKQEELFRKIQLPENLKIRINSQKNYGEPCEIPALMQAVKDQGKTPFLCPCERGKKIKCMKDCTSCWALPMDYLPIFLKH